MGDIHDYYRRIESERPRKKGDPAVRAKQYLALRGAATFFIALGYAFALIGTIATIVLAASTRYGSGGEAFAVVVFRLLDVTLFVAILIAAGGIIRVLIDIQENTSRTSRAVRDLRRPTEGRSGTT